MNLSSVAFCFKEPTLMVTSLSKHVTDFSPCKLPCGFGGTLALLGSIQLKEML